MAARAAVRLGAPRGRQLRVVVRLLVLRHVLQRPDVVQHHRPHGERLVRVQDGTVQHAGPVRPLLRMGHALPARDGVPAPQHGDALGRPRREGARRLRHVGRRRPQHGSPDPVLLSLPEQGVLRVESAPDRRRVPRRQQLHDGHPAPAALRGRQAPRQRRLPGRLGRRTGPQLPLRRPPLPVRCAVHPRSAGRVAHELEPGAAAAAVLRLRRPRARLRQQELPAADSGPGQEMAAGRGVQQYGSSGGAVRRTENPRRADQQVAAARLPERRRDLDRRRLQLQPQRLLAHPDLVLLTETRYIPRPQPSGRLWCCDGGDITGDDVTGRGGPVMGLLSGRIGAPVTTTVGGGRKFVPATNPTPVNEFASAIAALTPFSFAWPSPPCVCGSRPVESPWRICAICPGRMLVMFPPRNSCIAPTRTGLPGWLAKTASICPFRTQSVPVGPTAPPAWAAALETSATTTVPRMPATAFAARISMDSPERILSLATASAILPAWRSMVALPGTSVIVSLERSRTVTTALPPSSMRAID